MGEFIFWVILIPLLFYIIISTFSKEDVLKEKEISVSSVVSVSDYRAGLYPGRDRRDGAARGGADIEHDAGRQRQ